MPENGVRYAVRYAFRCADEALQKRNVLIRYAFRYALLTLLGVRRGGTLTKKTEKNGFFLVFKGRNSRKKTVFEGQKSQESACLQGFARFDVKFGCAFRLVFPAENRRARWLQKKRAMEPKTSKTRIIRLTGNSCSS